MTSPVSGSPSAPLVPSPDPDAAPQATWLPEEVGSVMAVQSLSGTSMIPGLSPNWQANIKSAALGSKWDQPLYGALALGVDWLDAGWLKGPAASPTYRGLEEALFFGAALGGGLYSNRKGLYLDATRWALNQPSLLDKWMPVQTDIPLTGRRLQIVSGNGAEDTAASIAAGMAAGHPTYGQALALLAYRAASVIHGNGLSLLAAAASPDTYFAALSVGTRVMNGDHDFVMPLWGPKNFRLSLPTLEYYRTPTDDYAQVRVFINPRNLMTPMFSIGATLRSPGVRVGGALLRMPVVKDRLFVTPQADVDVTSRGVGFNLGVGLDLRIIGQLGLTAQVNYARDDIMQNVANQTNGIGTSLAGIRWGF